jgi:hypothetical protein
MDMRDHVYPEGRSSEGYMGPRDGLEMVTKEK